jgi:hypothetical protein
VGEIVAGIWPRSNLSMSVATGCYLKILGIQRFFHLCAGTKTDSLPKNPQSSPRP